MSEQMTFEAIRNAISSRASEDGRMQLDWLDGLMIGNSGQGAVPASPTVSSAKASQKKTSAISGPYGSTLLQPSALQSLWESRLKTRLASIGSTECVLTWKGRVTPSGLPYSQLVPSTRPIEEIDFGSWRKDKTHAVDLPTSRSSVENDLPEPRNPRSLSTVPPMRGDPLAVTMWSTASARDWKDSAGMATTGINPDGTIRSRLDQLPRQAALYPTPTSLAKAKDGNNEAGNSAGLVAIRAIGLGLEASGLSAQTGKPGALDPTFVAWLMGFPKAWMDCAPTSMPKRPKR